MAKILIPTAYLGNIEYYAHLAQAEEVVLEIHENFLKQTFRNRCTIYGANGKLNLMIPLHRISGTRQKITEIRIAYDENWQKLHWKSFESAYRSSPYFEYYEHEFRQFFTTKYDKLFELNTALHQWILEKIDIQTPASKTTVWEKSPENITDLRTAFNPKKFENQAVAEVEYGQVFENKCGFLSNLSIADLLFNEGPAALSVLEEIKL